MKTKIKVKTKVLGTHRWKDCPHKEVAFLKNEHHHDFGISVEGDVYHDDRDIEFIKLRLWLESKIEYHFKKEYGIVRFGEMSCEYIGQIIYDELEKSFPRRNWKVCVDEDNNYEAIVGE